MECRVLVADSVFVWRVRCHHSEEVQHMAQGAHGAGHKPSTSQACSRQPLATVHGQRPGVASSLVPIHGAI